MNLMKSLSRVWGSGSDSPAPFDHQKALQFLEDIQKALNSFDIVDRGSTIEVVGDLDLSGIKKIPSLSGVHVQGNLSIDSHLRDQQGNNMPTLVTGHLSITDEGPPAEIDTEALRQALVYTGPPPRKNTP